MKTKTRFNKLTAWLLTFAMLMTFIPGFTLTANAAMCGMCGTDASYSLDDDGVLRIGGTGEIASKAFWGNADIKSVIIGTGITGLGASAFRDCKNLESIELPASITSISNAAFYGCGALVTINYYGTEDITPGNHAFTDTNVATINVNKDYTDDSFCGFTNITLNKILEGTGTVVEITLVEYAVDFDMGGHGTQVASQTVYEGNKVTKPADELTALGFVFDGWYKENTFVNEWDFANDVVTDDTTIYAKWNSVDTYTVSFDMGGHGTQVEQQTLNEGSLATMPSAPSADGFTFAGWFKESTFENYWDFASDKVTSDTTIYAKWIEGGKKTITPEKPTAGDGSAESPYEITNAQELYWFAAEVNEGNADICAVVKNDITVNSDVIVNGRLNYDHVVFADWTPIGKHIASNNIKPFSGTFDGGNYTISGLYVSTTSSYQGLFGYIQSATVKNVKVADSYFSGKSNVAAVVGCYGQTGTASTVTNCHNVGSVVIGSDYYAGGVVGGQYAPATYNAQIVVSNCSNSGSVTGAKLYVGGVIGYAEYFSEGTAISGCINTGTVTNTSTDRAQGTGGIAGYFGGSSAVKVEIVDCTNSGAVRIAEGGAQDYMGGIVGRNNYGHISNCNNNGAVSGYQFVGGIVGSNDGTVTNCQNTGAVSGTSGMIGGVVGSNDGTVTDCINGAAVQGDRYVGGINGSGTGLSGCTNTGDVTSNTYGAGGLVGYVDAAGSVENCHNEGKVKGTRYIGGLVGNHYGGSVTYTGCSNKGDVEGSSYDIGGLFGRITSGSTVTQCHNTGDVTCTGTYDAGSFDHGVGGLAGATFNAAIFENCYNTGAVNGGSNANVGGLVGFFTYASGSTKHYVKNSYNTGAVNGGKNTGGLFGSYESINVSENCYNTGAVIGGQNTGGLVGYHQSTNSGKGVIKNCYNTGSVSGTTYVGGLFGYQFYNNCLETSYNVGPVSGTSNIGGVIGNSNYKSVINCYYLDTCVTGGNTVTGATALTAEQMTDDTNWKTNYSGFDTTTSVWSKDTNSGNVFYLPKLDNYSPSLHVHSWTYSASDTNDDNVNDTITAACTAEDCTDTNGGSVTIAAPSDLVYSGSSIDAECTYTVWKPTDPTIVYNEVDRVNVTGQDITASITLGEATASVSYQISRRDLTASMVKLSSTSKSYNGSEQTVTVTVTYNSKSLTAGADYEVSGTTSATDISTGDGYAVTVTGKGNYTGSITKYWKINKATSPATITTPIEGWTYLDDPKTPVVTNNQENGEVTYTYYISNGRGFKKTGEANGAETEGGVPKYAGTYYVGASITETEHYELTTIRPGTDTAFVISPREVSNPTFEGLQAAYAYNNGNEIKPTFTLKDDKGNVIPESEYTVAYSDNTAVGEATITITDVTDGNYTVSGSAKFTIAAHSHEWKYELDGTKTINATCIVSDCFDKDGGSVTIAAPVSLVYTGNAIEVEVTNTLTTGDTVSVVYTPADKLTEGKPVNAGEYTASITVGGKEINVTYTIKPSYQITASSSNTAGGSVTGGGRYEENTSVTLTATANDGYMFAGWTENGSLIENTGAAYTFTAASDRTLVAVFVKLHTITVNLDGGTLTDAANEKIAEYKAQGIAITATNGVLTAKIPNGTEVNIKIADGKSYVTKSGFGFVGFKSSDNTEYKTDTKITVSADETYTMLWEEISSYPVTFNTNGGTSVGGQTIEDGGKITEPTAPTKTGYTFGGWYKEAALTIEWDFESDTVTGETTLYAKWTEKATVSIDETAQTYTYNKTEKTFVIKDTTLEDFTVSYKQGETPVANPTNAGSYDVVITRNEDDDYKAYSKTIIGGLVINEAQVLVPTISSKAYTGETLTADISDTADYTVTTNNGGISVGQYDVVLTLKDNANYKWADGTATAAVTIKFAITKATANVISNLSIAGWTYGETAKPPTASATFGTPSFTYVGTGDTAYAESETPPLNAGTYKVIAKVADTDNFDGAEGEKAFTIAKATPSYTVPTNLTATYGQTLANVQGLTTGFAFMAENTTPVGNTGNNTFKLKFTPTDANNYNVVENIDATVAVEPKEIGIEWGNTEFTYNKTEQKPAATATGLVSGDSCVITVTGGQTDAGNGYTATAQSLSNENYKLPANKTITFNIAKRSVTLTGVTIAGSKVYDGDTDASITNYGSVSNVVDGDAVTVDHTSASATYNDKNVGNSKTVTFTGFAITGTDAANYELSAQPASTTANITAKDITGAEITLGTALTYNGSELTQTITNATVDDLLITYNVLGNVNTGAGDYTLTIEGNGNFTGTAQKAYTIAKADATLGTAPAAITPLTYNAAEQTLVSAGENATGGTLMYKIGDGEYSEELPKATNAGIYTVYYKVVGDSNHNDIAQQSFTVTIAEKVVNSAIVLTAPASNQTPVTSIETDEYTATVNWSPAVTDKFAYSTDYTATITITPKANYTLTGITENGYTIEGAAVTNSADSGVITAVFPKTSSRPSSGGRTSYYTVYFNTNGAGEIESQRIKKGGVVARPQDPEKEGYTFGGWYTEAALKNEHKFSDEVRRTFTLYAKWNETGSDSDKDSSGHNCPSLSFSDLDITQWYHLDTDYVIENDIFRGITENTFAPGGNITRAMMVTVLYRAEGEPTVTGTATFEDVDSNAYYANAVIWGQQNGIIKGYSETEFAPDQSIIREQIAAIMHRYAQHKGYDVSVGENTNILSYDDFDSISEYAIASIQYAVGSGMIKGRTQSTLNPLDNATRAEIASMLHRFIETNK